MKRIKCQNSKCSANNPAYKNKGCTVCGGYGDIFIRSRVTCCGKQCWIRPGAFTVYDGKQYKSVDGLGLIYRIKGGIVCDGCYEVVEDVNGILRVKEIK